MAGVTVFFDTVTGNKQKLMNGSSLAQDDTPENYSALMTLHAYSGYNTTSVFKGLGKLKHLKILLKMPRYISVLAKLEDSWEVLDDIDAFTCAIFV